MGLFLYMDTLNYILFDDDSWDALLPLTYTRPVCELRVGIMTLREKWEDRLQTTVSYITQDYLSEKYPLKIEEDNIIINGALLANDFIIKIIQELDPNEALLYQDELIAARLPKIQFDRLMNEGDISELHGIELSDTPVIKFKNIYDLTQANSMAIQEDYQYLTKGKKSENISYTNRVSGAEQIFIAPGAQVEHAILNATGGPIYIGPDAVIMEGSMLRGPIAICDHATIKMGSKIYESTTVGPHCKVGGEVKGSILLSYSNKGHEGFLGDSYIGQWCNLGADTNTSNLKNNYGEVKLWSYITDNIELTGTKFCGLFMGDHSKAGINTMFNTGTVAGFATNVYGSGYTPKFIPSFTWGGIDNWATFKMNKMHEMAINMMSRRDIKLTDIEKKIYQYIFDHSTKYRHWEK